MLKKLRNSIIILFLVLTLCIPAGCTSSEALSTNRMVSIRLILKYLTRDYRDEIILGAKTAANEYGIDLNTQYLSPDDDPAKQADMLNDALKMGVDTVILDAEKSDALADAIGSAKKAGVPIVSIDSNWGKDNAFCSIYTDEQQMSRDVVSQLQKVAGKRCTVYLLNSVCPAGKTEDKETLLTAELAKHEGITVESIDYNTEFQDELKDIIKTKLNELRYNQIIIALNGFASSAAVATMKELNQKVHLIAFGSSLELVSEMENGRVDAMVVENAFTKGYMAVQNAVSAIKKEARPGDISLKARIVTLDKLFLPENQKLIFPLS